MEVQVCLHLDDNVNSRKLRRKAQRNSKFWLHNRIKDLKYLLPPRGQRGAFKDQILYLFSSQAY